MLNGSLHVFVLVQQYAVTQADMSTLVTFETFFAMQRHRLISTKPAHLILSHAVGLVQQ